MDEPARFRSPAYLAVLGDRPHPGRTRIARAAWTAIRAHVERDYPREACGLLLGRVMGDDFVVFAAHPARNRNEARAADRFDLDPADYRAAEARAREAGWDVIGVYHSHPDCPARPSPTDRDFAWGGWLYPIASVAGGAMRELRAWVFDDEAQRFFESEVQLADE